MRFLAFHFFFHFDNCATNNHRKKHEYYHRIIKFGSSDIYISKIKIDGTRQFIILKSYSSIHFCPNAILKCIPEKSNFLYVIYLIRNNPIINSSSCVIPSNISRKKNLFNCNRHGVTTVPKILFCAFTVPLEEAS